MRKTFYYIAVLIGILFSVNTAGAQQRFKAFDYNDEVTYVPKTADEAPRRYLDVNAALLERDNISAGDLISVVHDGVDYEFTVKKIASYIKDTYTIVATTGSRYLYFTVSGNIVTASVQIPEIRYEGIVSYDPALQMSYWYDHDHSMELTCKLDQFQHQLHQQIDSRMETMRVANASDLVNKMQSQNSQTTIALMIVYTNGALNWMETTGGGVSNVINQAMSFSQEALDVSGTLITLDLVHAANVNYNEAGVSSSDMLTYLRVNGDGIMDEVHTWRNTYEADIVSLFANVEDTGGLGYLITSPSGAEAFAFNLNRVQQITWTYTLVHEIGHNLGNAHSRNQTSQAAPASGGVFTYSTGWRWTGLNGTSYASVMTYEDRAIDGTISTRTAHFSNPSINYEGVPTGTASSEVPYGPADNARSMREMKDVTAAYRPLAPAQPPVITSISPSSATRGTRVTVVFTGQHFLTVNSVAWCSGTVLSFVSGVVDSATQATMTWDVLPSAALGDCNLQLQSPVGNSNLVPLTILAASATAPTVTTTTVTSVTSSSATSGGNVTSDGGASVTARGVCYATTQDPSTSNTCVTSGSGTGSFTASLTGLSSSTLYYVRAYATNTAGTSYGSQVSFTTSTPAVAPTVTTAAVTSIGTTTATAGGNVTDAGSAAVTARGVCYATTQDPTTANTCVPSGSGTGSFTASLTGLSSGTLYYVRAYATNSVGTSYGSQVSFTTSTPSVAPTVTTAAVSSIGTTSATAGGTVTSEGSAPVTVRGVCYATTQDPTTSTTCVSSGSGTGSFTASLTGLSASTLYYVRAYATNSVGTSYGSQVSFTTSTPGVAPTVTTAAVSSIGTTSATAGGTVTSEGSAPVTVRGVCYATTQDPTTLNTCVTSGSGTGSFTASLTGLSSGTLYYVRAYATNSVGTSYGSQVSFTTSTPSVAPTVTTDTVTSIGNTFATAGGNVTSEGSTPVTARGVCYATTQNPTTSNTCIGSIPGSGIFTGAFTVSLIGLSPSTLYYVRAYATNTAGTSYGGQLSFTTSTPAVAPTVATATVTSIGTTSATAGGTVTSEGSAPVTVRGVCYATTQNPTTSTTCIGSIPGSGIFTGAFTVSLIGLSPSTLYYVRAYATNTAGTSYGGQLSFTTSTPAVASTVATATVTSIGTTSATAGGTVTSEGSAPVTVRGVCYATTQNPTTLNTCISSGSGTGSFTASLSGLSSGTLYYVRAYATNTAGTSYGGQVSFTTQNLFINKPPTISPIQNVSFPHTINTPLSIPLSGISAGIGETGQNVAITARSSDPLLIPLVQIDYTSPQTVGTIRLQNDRSRVGSATIRVRVKDDAGTANGGVDSLIVSFIVNVLLDTDLGDDDATPKEYQLDQNYPNPFNPSTQISFSIPSTQLVRLAIYDLMGRQRFLLLNKEMAAGNHTITVDASSLSSGIYMYVLSSGSFTASRRMTLIK